MGRAAELTVLEDAIAAARTGTPSVVLIGGDAGIGKSSLLSEAASRADVPLLLGRCMAVGGDAIPLAPLADLLRWVRRSGAGAIDEIPAMSDLARWLSPEAPGAAPTGSLFASVLDLVGRLLGEDPVVVGFEDLHWADPAAWDVFELLARNLIDERVVLVGTYRARDVTMVWSTDVTSSARTSTARVRHRSGWLSCDSTSD